MCQRVWIIKLVGELLKNDYINDFKLLVDNQAAIALSKNPIHHSQGKHIDMIHLYIREIVEKGLLKAEHISTK